MAVAVYVRVSTEEQRERQSIRTQRELADRYCEYHELTVFRTYSDDGVSGTVAMDSRPDGQQILRDARLKRFDQLVIYKLDRLGRETRLILNVVAELEKLGVRIRSMTEEFDTGTATGRLMLTMLSGFASHEREVIRERSVAGTQRLAEAGAWLGGIVPYGYRKVGEKRAAQIVVADDAIPGLLMTEADVIREVFRIAAVEQSSCRVIAAHLNKLRVPCAYSRDERLLLHGKRKEATSGIWGPGRVRGLITNRTYMGRHEYGKRTKSARPVISRSVPSIVTEELWGKAQESLKANFLFGKRSARSVYLLRGLIKCGLCGRTYIGTKTTRANGKQEFRYRCNGAHTPVLYPGGQRCQSKSISGEYLEQQIWSDVEAFIRNPGQVLEDLRTKLCIEAADSATTRTQLEQLEQLVAGKASERARIVGLFRRGRLSDADLDKQLDEIAKEESALQAQLEELQHALGSAGSTEASMDSAQGLLAELSCRLDGLISAQVKRRLVEVLVSGIRADTVEVDGVKRIDTTVTYRFGPPEQALALLLPRIYTGSAGAAPKSLNSVGDHIRKRRIEMKLLQREVAMHLGVDKTSVFNWEANTSTPDIRCMPAIIRFLGFNPLPVANTVAEQLVRQRTTSGISQKEAAGRLGVDPGMLAKWERGEREPTGVFLGRMERFLDGEEVSGERRAG